MVEIPDSIQCLFSASVSEQNESFVIEIPRHEVDHGGITVGDHYRVAVLSHESTSSEPSQSTDNFGGTHQQEPQGPPVEEGELVELTIETRGDQGDGIAKVDRGYVVIVPNGEPGTTVTVEIDTVRKNVAFAEIVSNED
ncbi:TRAM domain-containing protein [Halobium palmae]|uniref:TRAM domain-containing protein n=1 Tax=Halobium palmae TaxID=1776492 RepID=A0ABD5RVP3_9EURY